MTRRLSPVFGFIDRYSSSVASVRLKSIPEARQPLYPAEIAPSMTCEASTAGRSAILPRVGLSIIHVKSTGTRLTGSPAPRSPDDHQRGGAADECRAPAFALAELKPNRARVRYHGSKSMMAPPAPENDR